MSEEEGEERGGILERIYLTKGPNQVDQLFAAFLGETLVGQWSDEEFLG